MNFRLQMAALLVAAMTPAQGITYFEGASNAALDVRVLDENQLANPAALVLQGIEVLPIEMTGRVHGQELHTDVARLDERNGLPRVELPGACRLFAYKRLGGQFWGYLLIPSSGQARVVLEVAGRGPGGVDNPFADRIAVAADGRHMAVPAAFVGMHLVRLDGGVFASTGTTARFVIPPAAIETRSIMAGDTHVFLTGDDRMFRVAYADGAPVTEHTPPSTASRPRLKDEFAMSGDGSTVAFLYGPDNDTLEIYLLDSTSAQAQLMPTGPHKYEEPGYLPDGAGHPRLVLNEDASRLFFVRAADPQQPGGQLRRDESYLYDTSGALPLLQITQDAIFEPYIGIHILPSFKGQRLYVAIGDADQMDWFEAELAPTGASVTNLTGTGSMAQPFPSGTLVPDKVHFAGPTAFATDGNGTTQTLRTIDLNTQQSTVVYQDVPADPIAGSSTTAATPDFFIPGPGDRLFHGASGSLIGALPPGFKIAPPVNGSFFGLTTVTLLPNWGLQIFYMPDGSAVFGFLLADFRQATVTHQDGVLLHSDALTLYLAAFQPTRVVPLPPAPPVRVFVSGAGG